MNDDLTEKEKVNASGWKPSTAIKMSDLCLAVTFQCKVQEQERLQMIVDRLESDCEVIFEELLLRKNNDFDAVQKFLKECSEFAS